MTGPLFFHLLRVWERVAAGERRAGKDQVPPHGVSGQSLAGFVGGREPPSAGRGVRSYLGENEDGVRSWDRAFLEAAEGEAQDKELLFG